VGYKWIGEYVIVKLICYSLNSLEFLNRFIILCLNEEKQKLGGKKPFEI